MAIKICFKALALLVIVSYVTAQAGVQQVIVFDDKASKQTLACWGNDQLLCYVPKRSECKVFFPSTASVLDACGDRNLQDFSGGSQDFPTTLPATGCAPCTEFVSCPYLCMLDLTPFKCKSQAAHTHAR